MPRPSAPSRPDLHPDSRPHPRRATKPRGPRRKSVALMIETSNAYARGLLSGIHGYIREHDPWTILLLEHGRGQQPDSWPPHWSGDGMIARIETKKIAKLARQAGCPVVDVSAARLLADAPWVETDDSVIARLAVDHLLERGFRRFAYCGDDRFNWSTWRMEKFVRYLAEAGFPCEVYGGGEERESDATELDGMARWISSLAKPVGVFACYDIRGQQLLQAARMARVRVPDEVAVIGVDNDQLLCDLSDPPLTSIVPDAYKTGYRAAELLDAMMRGKKVAAEAERIRPIGVVTRRSTDVLAVDDEAVARAAHFIREHACERITVEHVAAEVGLTRHALEKRFRKLLNATPHQRITDARLQRARELLRETDLSLDRIAKRTGYRHAEYLCAVFKKQTGQSPGRYRESSKH